MANNNDAVKIRDIAPTAVRLKPELRAQLSREAAINARSLHAEILFRLQASLAEPSAASAANSSVRAMASPTLSTHHAAQHVPVWPAVQTTAYTDAERTLVSYYRRLTPEKQLSLLTLLR